MKFVDDLTPLMPSINALQQLLKHFNDKGMIIGGIAVSLLGKPRLTADVDAVIILPVEDINCLIEAAEQVGLLR